MAVIHWSGTEDQQHAERMKACRDRRKLYPGSDCDKDGSCSECEYDMAIALQVRATSPAALLSPQQGEKGS